MNEKRKAESLLPGQEFVTQGLADLARNQLSESALLLLVAAPRLRRLGLQVPVKTSPVPWEHLLYARLEERLGAGAHSYYNSLIRRITSFAHALEQEQSHAKTDGS